MPRWSSAALLGGAFLALALAERGRPLRRRVAPEAPRLIRNAGVGALTAAEIAAIERPVVQAVLATTERRRWGLLARLRLPRWARTVAAIVLLDYSLYVWHVLLHRVPFLWRAHLAHHIDRDLDVSTALRFHFAEFLASVPWRAAQIALIGVREQELVLWQRLTLVEVMFHHSNLRLPLALERALALLIVTPRLHGIHHSTRRAERDRNFSSGLTLWDRLHGSWLAGVPQDEITIGVPPYRKPSDVTLRKTLAVPFKAG